MTLPMPPLVDTSLEDPGWQAIGLPELAETAATSTLRHLGLDPARYEIALLGCDDDRIAALNASFRGKPAPTNVLSWPSQNRAPATPGAAPPHPSFDGDLLELGDVAIALGICKAEAEAARLPFPAHVCHVIVHGVLHLLGYDHMDEADADLMERTEIAILAGMGLHDPYGRAGAMTDEEDQ